MPINKEQYNRAAMMAARIGGKIGGSCVIDKETANDVDIFVGYSAWELAKARGYVTETWKGPVIDGLQLYDSFHNDREYYMENNRDSALHCTYRSHTGILNIIVVEDHFVVAFEASRLEMHRRPDLYKEKDARIKLHHDFRKVIHDMFSPTMDASVELDEFPF